jgi:beta-galactosidase
LMEQAESWHVLAGESQWCLDKESGRITGWRKGGRERLLGELADHFYRAPLDNDIGTSEADHQDPHSWIARWQQAGLGELSHRCLGITRVGEASLLVEHGYFVGEQLKILTHWRHDFEAGGAMRLAIDALVSDDFPSLPRIGASLWLAETVDSIEWLGRGPHENYPDRCLSADLGRWQLPITALHTPYIFPTDNGLRTQVRELQLADLRVEGEFHFSISPYRQSQLAEARHQTDLIAEGGLHLCLDGFYMGIGGDDSWSQSVRPEYWLTPGRYYWNSVLS